MSSSGCFVRCPPAPMTAYTSFLPHYTMGAEALGRSAAAVLRRTVDLSAKPDPCPHKHPGDPLADAIPVVPPCQ